MSDASPVPVSAPDHPVWRALSSDEIGPSDAALSFPRRLARENGWSLAHAERVIAEYKRFCFLAITAGHVVTPSDAVDQAWHLHLAYSRDYWDRFCPDILGQKLHHGPTTGGTAQLHRHAEQYARTLQSYEAVFGPAPADIWPDARRSLRDDPRARRVHPRDAVIIPRPIFNLLLALAAILMVGMAAYLWWRH
jgi:hypothetical protein